MKKVLGIFVGGYATIAWIVRRTNLINKVEKSIKQNQLETSKGVQTERISKTYIPRGYRETFPIELCNVRGKVVINLN